MSEWDEDVREILSALAPCDYMGAVRQMTLKDKAELVIGVANLIEAERRKHNAFAASLEEALEQGRRDGLEEAAREIESRWTEGAIPMLVQKLAENIRMHLRYKAGTPGIAGLDSTK